MVLHDGDDDLVTFLYKRASVGVRHEIQALGGVPREDDLLVGACVDEGTDGLTRILVGLGGLDREIIETAHRVCVFLRIVVHHRIEDALRLLGRRPVVEVGEAAVEDRELLKNCLILTLTLFSCDFSHHIAPPYGP